MEPITHLLTGACIGRSGFNRRTAYATVAATYAAEAPDLDMLWALGGPVVGFAHHRGITHSLIGAPVMALGITGCVWIYDRLLHRALLRALGRARSGAREQPGQPIRWLWIWLTAFVADLSHIALDWTNNYGVRPFFPFDKRWFSGDLVFIAEPVIWALLLGALIVPALLGLADREIGARATGAQGRFKGRAWAIAALVGMVLLWCWRWTEHGEARNLVEAAQVTPVPAKRIALEPYPFNPYRWHAILETETAWQVAEVDTRSGAVDSDPRINSLFKPPVTPAVVVARRTRLGEVYQDWAQWPVVRDIGAQPAIGVKLDPPAAGRWSDVEFSDLRFAYSYLDTGMAASSDQRLSHALAYSGLTGWVYVANGGVMGGGQAAGEFMNGREQR